MNDFGYIEGDLDIWTDFFEVKEERRDALYTGSLPVSLDILRLKDIAPKEFYTIPQKSKRIKIYKGKLINLPDVEKLYTDAIINVTFDKALRELLDSPLAVRRMRKNKVVLEEVYTGNVKTNAYELREKFYEEGFSLRFGENVVEYVKYKRSSSKAREGSHLFIKKELKEAMDDWAKFGVKYEAGQSAPLTIMKAYEGLTSSGIEKTITIYPHEILLIRDAEVPVEIKASVTECKQGNEITVRDDDNYEIKNNIWDGQSLADTSLFDIEANGQKGMMLLRNSFFKSCAFNTNIQKCFDDVFADSKPEYIQDMFGRDVKLLDIKLITTPSSLKFLKFFDRFKGKDKQEKEKNCYEKWLASISEVFGVCKSEASSPFGDYHQLSYQIINSRLSPALCAGE